ncbi:IMPACT family member in pol 5'region isoform X4 [Juglans microcarpa x Juglans regia]|uniref:IMPACT family member in pol 5'region isoform X4 n=1 Tax=Juglans microcarpa x Juglans regia TaxID=2249226 RepID=UPI001B7E1E97|nr:IMPACT family member in pol 5'region isoform X4 [Juglans microcarpa x Juglans regia]
MPTAITPAAPSYLRYQKLHHRISASLFVLAAGAKRAMSTGNSSSSGNAGAYTTVKERVTFEREIKKSKFIAIAGPISDERSALSFLSQVRDPRATHNCWAYKVGDQYRSNDDGEPSGTAGKPIHSAIVSSGIDRVMVVVIRYFGGIKLGTGGLVRAYGGVASECLRNAPTCLVKSKVPMGVEVPFDLLGILYHQVKYVMSLYGHVWNKWRHPIFDKLNLMFVY